MRIKIKTNKQNIFFYKMSAYGRGSRGPIGHTGPAGQDGKSINFKEELCDLFNNLILNMKDDFKDDLNGEYLICYKNNTLNLINTIKNNDDNKNLNKISMNNTNHENNLNKKIDIIEVKDNNLNIESGFGVEYYSNGDIKLGLVDHTGVVTNFMTETTKNVKFTTYPTFRLIYNPYMDQLTQNLMNLNFGSPAIISKSNYPDPNTDSNSNLMSKISEAKMYFKANNYAFKIINNSNVAVSLSDITIKNNNQIFSIANIDTLPNTTKIYSIPISTPNDILNGFVLQGFISMTPGYNKNDITISIIAYYSTP